MIAGAIRNDCAATIAETTMDSTMIAGATTPDSYF